MYLCNVFMVFSIPHLILAQTTTTQSTVSITSEAAWSSLRGCGQNCINNVGNYVGCPNPLLNACYCRTDLASAVTPYLATCVYSSCTVGDRSPDESSVDSIYRSYCLKNGFTIPPPPTNVATTTDISTGTSGTSTGPYGTTSLSFYVTQTGSAATKTVVLASSASGSYTRIQWVQGWLGTILLVVTIFVS
jgi:hypothetical protein